MEVLYVAVQCKYDKKYSREKMNLLHVVDPHGLLSH